MSEPLLTEREVAERLQVRPGLLREWRYLTNHDGRQHGPKFVKLGRLVRYRPTDIAAYLRG